ALVVGACEADHGRCDGTLRVRTALLRIRPDADEAFLQEAVGRCGIREALDVEEARPAVDQLRVQGVCVDSEELLRRDGDRARLRQLPGVGVHRRRRLPDRELDAGL